MPLDNADGGRLWEWFMIGSINDHVIMNIVYYISIILVDLSSYFLDYFLCFLMIIYEFQRYRFSFFFGIFH